MDKRPEKCTNIALWSIIGQNVQMNDGLHGPHSWNVLISTVKERQKLI